MRSGVRKTRIRWLNSFRTQKSVRTFSSLQARRILQFFRIRVTRLVRKVRTLEGPTKVLSGRFVLGIGISLIEQTIIVFLSPHVIVLKPDMIYSGHSFSFSRVAALIVPMISTTAMSTGPSAYRFRGFARRHILVILWKLRRSHIFRPADKIHLRLSVRKTVIGIFPIRQVLWLRNRRHQFLPGI